MPDIFKNQVFVESDDSVQIPDFEIARVPFETVVEEIQEEETPWAPPPPPPLTRAELEVRYASELVVIRQDAEEQAYHDAIQKKSGELQDCIGRVDSTLDELNQLHRQFVEQYAQELKYLAVDVAEKIMRRHIEDDDLAMREMVLQAISAVKHYKWLSVEVSEKLVGLVELLKVELRKSEYGGKAEVVPSGCPTDTCRMSTEEGTAISTISVQIQNLREAFADEEAYE